MSTVIDLTNLGSQGFIFDGAFADQFGASVSGAGDVNGDGYDDMIMAAPGNNAGGTDSGLVYVVYGGPDGYRTNFLSVLPIGDGFRIQGDVAFDDLGLSVSGAGDFNGDGFADVIVAGDRVSSTGDRPLAYVIFGSQTQAATVDLTNLSAIDGFRIAGSFESSTPIDVRVDVSSAGDLNGDGFDDIVVGTPDADSASVIFGRAGAVASIDLAALDPDDGFTITGASGNAVSSAGDVNGDGVDDLIVSAAGAEGAGAAYVIFGHTGGFSNLDLASLSADEGFAILGASAGDAAGSSVSSAGDVNGDGIDDLIIGAPRSDDGGPDSGNAYVIFGRHGAFGTIDLDNLGSAGFRIQGVGPGDVAGWNVSAVGDINNDSFDDLIVSATDMYVIYGRAGSATLDLDNLDSAAGFVVRGALVDTTALLGTGAGDIDGDGLPDILIGSQFYDDGAGRAYVLFSPFGPQTYQGTSGNDTLVGGSGNDILSGLEGNDSLNGGLGADSMNGGLGDDIFYVDNAGDQVIENVSEGTDRVVSSIAYTLAANVENLTLTGSSAIDGTGNSLDNLIIGNGAANTLKGGVGADKMYGGLGDDTYIVDDAGDRAVETSATGTDLVKSSVSFTMGRHIENLTLTGTNAINGTGNSLDNIIIGNGAANTLKGGAGADTLYGGLGDDTYIMDNVGDQAIETSGAGTDLVKSSVSFTLGSNVENLTLTGSAAINGTGNSLDNLIQGNSANNTISGGDGADRLYGNGGSDVLTGGDGNDSFIYTSVSNSLPGAADFITDFTSTSGAGAADDKIDLSGIDADTNTAGDQAFSFDPTHSFTPTAHGAWLGGIPTADPSGGFNWVLFADTNGDTTPDFELHFHTAGGSFSVDDIVW